MEGNATYREIDDSTRQAAEWITSVKELKMPLRLFLWLSFILATAVFPSVLIGGIAKAKGWPRKRCYVATQAMVTGLWMLAWFLTVVTAGNAVGMAPFGIPAFRWLTEGLGSPWRFLWFAAPVAAPVLAQKIAASSFDRKGL
jgi:hypothetical protein